MHSVPQLSQYAIKRRCFLFFRKLSTAYETKGCCVIGPIRFAADVLSINGRQQKQRLEREKTLDDREEDNKRKYRNREVQVQEHRNLYMPQLADKVTSRVISLFLCLSLL